MKQRYMYRGMRVKFLVRYIMAVSISIAVPLLFFSGCRSKEMGRAEDFLAAGMCDQVVPLLQMEVQANPKNAEAHFLLGKAYLCLASEKDAKESFSKAILLDGSYSKKVPQAYFEVAINFLLDEEKVDKAIDYMKSAYSANKDLRSEAAASMKEAAIRLMDTKSQKAVKLAKMVLDLDPTADKDGDIYFLARIIGAESKGVLPTNCQNYLTVFQKGKRSAQVLFMLAEHDYDLRNFAKAKGEFNQVAIQYSDTEWGQKAKDKLTNWREVITVRVDASQPWTDAGITIKPGRLLNISASGLVKESPSALGRGPDGIPLNKPEAQFLVVKGLNLMALIGKVGEDGSPFLVGQQYSGQLPQEGKLYLGVNDVVGFGGEHSDNSGSFIVTIVY